MRNCDYVVRGLGAAVLSAEMNVKRLPEARGISLAPTVNFKDDTVENQNNPKIVWWTKGKRKYRLEIILKKKKEY